MKKLFSFLAITTLSFTALHSYAQPTASLGTYSKEAKPIASPKDSIVTTTSKGVTITLTYGSPGTWGRTIGDNLDPMTDSVWRAGANEATTFAVSKDVTIDGKKLPAGKYALFAKKHGNDWTFIFNKEWNTWGAYDYQKNMGSDALQVKASGTDKSFNERLKYVIDENGKVSMLWGKYAASFMVK